MEVEILVEPKTDMALIEREYPDIYEDGDEGTRFFVGKSSDDDLEPGETEWMTWRECVALCGFVAGAMPDAETLIEGNGGWAQGMISRTDFSGFAVSKSEKRSYMRDSNIYWKAFRRGKRIAGLAKRKSKTKR